MKKYTDLIEMLEKIFGKGSVSRTIGTRTNVVRFPKGKQPIDPTVGNFDVEGTAIKSPDLVQTIENSIADRMGDITKMNDQELLTYTANVRRLLNFKEPPVQNADVIKFGSGEEIKGKGLEQLIEKQGTVNPPTTVAGRLETQGKKLEKAGEDLKEITEPKSVIGGIIKDYGDFDKYMQSSQKTGYVRATVRQIMREDIQAGKLKLPKELQDQVMQGIGEPIDIYRKVYGEGALEQIDSLADDLGQFRTEEEAAKFARSKYTFEPKVKPVDESKTYEELEDILKKDPEPEGKANGGRIGYETGGGVSEEQNLIEEILSGKIKIGADFANKNKDDPFNKYGFGKRDIKDPRLGIEYIMDPGNERSSKIGISVGPKGGSINFMKPFSEKLNEEKNEDVIQTYIDFARNVWGVEVTEQEARKALGIYDMPDTNIRNELPPEEIEEKADGGRIGMGLGGMLKGLVFKGPNGEVYGPLLTAVDRLKIEALQNPQTTTQQPEIPLTLNQRYNKYLSAAGSGTGDELYKSYRANLDKKADGGRIGYAKGKRVKSSIDKLLENLNKKTQGKKSMESVNPKTGEVTIPKKPIRRAEEPTGMTTMDVEPEIVDERSIKKTKSIMTIDDLKTKHKDAFEAHDQIFNVDINDKIAPDMIAESMAETRGKDYFSLSQEEQSNLYKKALAYVDDVRMTKRQNKSLYVKGDAITEENFGNTPFAPSQETLDNLKKAREMTKGMSLEEEMNMVLNQYDKSMFIKNEQGMVDVTNPENVQKMALLLKKDHPELYRRLEGGAQTNVLEEFDITGREPNANGGIAGLL